MSDALLNAEAVEKELRFWNIPGLAAGVNLHGEDVLLEGYGVRDREDGLPMTPDSLGCIGSCTKSFTSAMIETLADDGILDLDKPVRDYVPDFRMMDPEASEHVTLRDMLCHRTGLPAHDGMWPQEHTSRREFLHEIRYLQPVYPFRGGTEYSNVMYGAAGAIAEAVTGKTWEELVQKRILDPLDMHRTCLCPQDSMKDGNHAAGYFSKDRHSPLQRMGILDMNVDAPAGNIYSCPSEMLHWLRMHLCRGLYAGKRILSERGADEVHRGIVRNASYPWQFPEFSEIVLYGLGWRNAIFRGHTVIYHTGEVEGYCALEAFVPSMDVCIMLQVNHHKPCAPFLFSMLLTILDAVLNEEGEDAGPIDWPSRFHPFDEIFGGAHYNWKVDCMEGAAPDPDNRKTMTHPIADYTGTFSNPAYGTHSVYAENGYLVLHYWNQALIMEHCRYDTFRIEGLKEDTIYLSIPMSYHYNEKNGDIDGFFLKLEPETPPMFFRKLQMSPPSTA